MADLRYTYFGICLHCDTEFHLEMGENHGQEYSIICPICNDGIGDITLNRIGRGRNPNYEGVVVKGRRTTTTIKPPKESNDNKN